MVKKIVSEAVKLSRAALREAMLAWGTSSSLAKEGRMNEGRAAVQLASFDCCGHHT